MSCVQLTAEDGGKGQLELVAERVLVLWIAIVLAPQHEDDCLARCIVQWTKRVTSVSTRELVLRIARGNV